MQLNDSMIILNKGVYFWLGLVLPRKIIKLFFFKPKPVQTDRFWLGYFRTKTKTQRAGFGSVRFGLVRLFYT